MLFFQLKFQLSNRGFGESDSLNGIIFLNEKCWLFCVFNVYMYFTALYEKMRYYWTDEKYQINYSKRVTRAVEIVYSCSRESGVLCTVARSWLLFLHDDSEWKNFESNTT